MTPQELHESHDAVTKLLIELYRTNDFELANSIDRYITWLREELALVQAILDV